MYSHTCHVLFAIVYIKHVTPINRPLGLISFILIVVVKVSVSTSKFYVFDIGCSLHLKHKNCIDAAALVLYMQWFSSHTYSLIESYS